MSSLVMSLIMSLILLIMSLISLPPANELCEKVMFSQACVFLSGEVGRVSLLPCPFRGESLDLWSHVSSGGRVSRGRYLGGKAFRV